MAVRVVAGQRREGGIPDFHSRILLSHQSIVSARNNGIRVERLPMSVPKRGLAKEYPL